MKPDLPTRLIEHIWILANKYVTPEPQYVEWPRKKGSWLQTRLAEIASKQKEIGND